MAKPSVKELESKAGQVGHIHAMAYLRQISAGDLASYVGQEETRASLRKAYEAAVSDVGEKKAMKTATFAAYSHAERTILTAQAAGRAPRGGFRPVLDTAEKAVRDMLAREPAVRPTATINGRPQSMPELDGEPVRRTRQFWECVRRLADDPLAQSQARGRLLGEGSGLEQLLAVIAPVFEREQSMIRWAALRGGITSLYLQTMDQRPPDNLIAVTEAMGLRLTTDQGGGVSVTELTQGQLPGQQLSAALALGTTVYGLLAGYGRDGIAEKTMPETNAYPPFAALTDAGGLGCIAWSAVALLRVGSAQELAPVYPEPDALSQPGWYAEPVFGRFERYWDGSDWTSRVRGKSSEQSVSLRLPPAGAVGWHEASSVDLASLALGFDGSLDLHVGGVPVQHAPVFPAHQAHQVAFGAAAFEPVVGEGMPSFRPGCGSSGKRRRTC